jgi:DNA polymerase sigma
MLLEIKSKDKIIDNDYLHVIEEHLNNYTDVVKTKKYIKGAAYPVLKLECTPEYSNKRLDITIKEMRHTGVNCVNLVKEYIIEYELILRPLVFILKQMVYMADLNDPFTGGINSYGLILMVVAFLQNELRKSPITKEHISKNLGHFFLNFLNTYGNVIDYNQVEIRPSLISEYRTDLGQFVQKQELNHSPNITLVIQDPLFRGNNVTRSTFAFYIIRVAFS